jgi:hypothetical protein
MTTHSMNLGTSLRILMAHWVSSDHASSQLMVSWMRLLSSGIPMSGKNFKDRESFFFEIAASFKVNECERFHLFLPVIRMSFLLLFGLSIAADPFSRRDHILDQLQRKRILLTEWKYVHRDGFL